MGLCRASVLLDWDIGATVYFGTRRLQALQENRTEREEAGRARPGKLCTVCTQIIKNYILQDQAMSISWQIADNGIGIIKSLISNTEN